MYGCCKGYLLLNNLGQREVDGRLDEAMDWLWVDSYWGR